MNSQPEVPVVAPASQEPAAAVSGPQAEPALSAPPQTALQPPHQEQPPLPQKPNRGRKAGRIKKLVVTLVILGIAAGAVYYFFPYLPFGRAKAAEDTVTYLEHTVSKKDITVSLSGSGTLQPADSYTVTGLVSGEILSAPFEEGDMVEKDSLLYQIDSSDLNTNIQNAESNLNQTRKNYQKKRKSLEDLNIYANADGTVIQLMVDEGDAVNMGQVVAVIQDISVMQIKLPFVTDAATGFTVGQTAVVTMDGTFEQITGTVSKISAIDEVFGDSLPVRQVTIDIPNPGGLSTTRTASAMIDGHACSASGTFAYQPESQVTADISGEVKTILTAEGGKVQDGQLMVTLVSENLDEELENALDSVESAETSLQNQYDNLKNFQITSPISGTIVEKYYKAGDNMDTGRSLCIIYDLTYLTMTLSVDELDISKVTVGQSVDITADAVKGKTYTGTVTRVGINGTTSGGVTTYPVTIRIDETDGLLPGMNVDAEIVVLHRESVLAIPVASVSRGNRVLVKTATGEGAATEGEAATPPAGTENTGAIRQDATTAQGGQRPQGGGQRSEGSTGNMPGSFDTGNLPDDFDTGSLPEGFEGQMPAFQFEASQEESTVTAEGGGLPDGYAYVVVTLGESDGGYIEVLEGLNEGDIIAYLPSVSTGGAGFATDSFGMMPGASVTYYSVESGNGGEVFAAPSGGGIRP